MNLVVSLEIFVVKRSPINGGQLMLFGITIELSMPVCG